MNNFKKFAFISTSLLILSACSMTPDYQRPDVETPAWRSAQSIQNAEIAADWWTGFESAELNDLINRALENNNNLQASLQRVEQARADLKVAGASLLPSADVTASYMSGSTVPMNITDMRNNGIPEYTTDIGISYELDLFGANRAKTNAAESKLLSSAYQHDALALVIMGDVAQNYFNVLNLRERVLIAKGNLRAGEDLLDVAEARFQTGARTQLDITRQETQVARAKAAVTALEQELALAQNALAVLIGEPPQSFHVSGKNINALHLPDRSWRASP